MGVNQIKKKKVRVYSETFKRGVVEYYLSHDYCKQYVWNKFVNSNQEKGSLLKWMRQLGYAETNSIRINPSNYMEKETTNKTHQSKELKRLKAELKDARLQIIAYKKMIDIIEKDYKVPFSKKSDTKS